MYRGFDSRLRWCAAEFKLTASFIVYCTSSHFCLNSISLRDVFEMLMERLLDVRSLYEMEMFPVWGVHRLFPAHTLPSHGLLRGLG